MNVIYFQYPLYYHKMFENAPILEWNVLETSVFNFSSYPPNPAKKKKRKLGKPIY